MSDLGKLLVVAGLVLVVIGALLWTGVFKGVGRLPGDIHIQKENFTFVFPLATCVLISAILTFLFWLFRR